ncbi:sensor histidine kinase [Chloroflexus sp.]|uniref:sensor histidine kinase n=1 Tax=Chloroflexus sp. TaxID=1904827 RepID=UPI002633D0F8|nr:ATP-binding protein [uncultured Chloroflexus sp.]
MNAIRSSIQLKILLLLLGLALPPLILIGWLGLSSLNIARETTVAEGTASLRQQATASLLQRASDKAQFYDAALIGVQQQVEAVAGYAIERYGVPASVPGSERVWIAPRPTNELLRAYAGEAAFVRQFIPILRQLVERNPLVNIGYIALESGGVIAFDNEAVIDQLLTLEAFDPRVRPWYTKARDAGVTVWTEPYVDANTGLLATTCASPLYDGQGRFIGVVAFDLLLETIQQDLLTVGVGSSGYALLINANGDVVVRPNMQVEGRWDQPYRTENLLETDNAELRAVAARMVAREAGVQLIQAQEQSSYVAYAPITTAGWSVALVIPANEIDAPAIATGQRLSESQSRLWNQLVAVLLMIIVSISMLGILLSLSFTNRISVLREGVQAVAGGDLTQRLPAAGSDEIGQLVDAFNRMTDTLQSKIFELEENSRQLATLNTVSNELKSILSWPVLLETIPKIVCERLGFDRAVLYLVDGEVLRAVSASFGPGNELQAQQFLAVANTTPLRLDGSSVEADVVRSRKAIIVDNPWEHPLVDKAKQAVSASRSFVQAPIFGRNDVVIGILSADYKLSQRPVQARDAAQLLMFASMVGLTIENVQLYNELEQQVAQRTEELRAALERAQLADRRKSDFLASISHELRTPLNAIIGFSTVLLDDTDQPLTPTQREDVQSINRNGRFLLHLINELLDLARIEAGHLNLEIEEVNLHLIASEVCDTVQSLLRNRPVMLRMALPEALPVVAADSDRLRQILFNLLSNAIKFTERGTITVSAQLYDEVDADGKIGRYVAVSVSDTGIGIPLERQQDIFGEFVQIHGRRSRLGGTGLGLAITRKLVLAQGGRIWVDSTPGIGSTFTFTVPVAQSALLAMSVDANVVTP